MIIHVYPNAKTLAQAAATLLAAQITGKPGSVLGLATGSSPVATYQELIRLFQEKAVDFSQATTFNLDEYVSLPISHPCSYHAFMHDNLFAHVNFKQSFLPDGNAPDLAAECRRYDAAIAAAGGGVAAHPAALHGGVGGRALRRHASEGREGGREPRGRDA